MYLLCEGWEPTLGSDSPCNTFTLTGIRSTYYGPELSDAWMEDLWFKCIEHPYDSITDFVAEGEFQEEVDATFENHGFYVCGWCGIRSNEFKPHLLGSRDCAREMFFAFEQDTMLGLTRTDWMDVLRAHELPIPDTWVDDAPPATPAEPAPPAPPVQSFRDLWLARFGA